VARLPLAGEIPVRQRGAVQIGGSPFGEILTDFASAGSVFIVDRLMWTRSAIIR